jgi:hypothetical protein
MRDENLRRRTASAIIVSPVGARRSLRPLNVDSTSVNRLAVPDKRKNKSPFGPVYSFVYVHLVIGILCISGISEFNKGKS